MTATPTLIRAVARFDAKSPLYRAEAAPEVAGTAAPTPPRPHVRQRDRGSVDLTRASFIAVQTQAPRASARSRRTDSCSREPGQSARSTKRTPSGTGRGSGAWVARRCTFGRPPVASM